MVSPAAIERGRQAGFHDYVAKFDRPGLIAALKEQTAEISRRHEQAQPGHKAETMTTKTETIEGTIAEYVTAVIGGQLFGLPISRVQDVFIPERLTRVPLSSGESPACSTCAAASSPWSTCAPGSACRRARTASPRWRSASTCAANPTAC